MADLSLLVLTLFWGTTFTFVKGVLAVTSPGVFLTARFALAAAVLAALSLARRERLRDAFSRDAILLGLFMLAGFVFQTIGLRYTTPARSGFITGLSVLIVPFVARFFLGRRVRPSAWAGVALAVAGLALLTRPFAGGIEAEVRLGDALTVGCAVAFGLQVTFTSEWSPRHRLVPFTAAQVSVGFAGALAVLVPIEGPRLDPSGMPAFAGTVLFTGVLMTAVAFLVMNWAQRHTTAVRAALIFSLEPVSAALFSHWYGGEPLSAGDWAGGALIVLGVVVGEVGAAIRRSPPPPGEAPAA